MNTRTALVFMLCVFALLLSSQALSLKHELTHIEHEQTDLCKTLHSFGSNAAVVTPQVGAQFFVQAQDYFATDVLSLFDTRSVLNQRSRAPPLLS